MVKAAGKVVAIYVDCDWGNRYRNLSERFGVGGFPTVAFADYTGAPVGDPVVGAQGAEAYVSRLEDLAANHARPVFFSSWEKAVEQAKKDKKPVLYVFFVKNDASKRLEAALLDPSVREIRSKFVIARSEISKDSPDAARFGVAKSVATVVLALDPRVEKPEDRQLRLPADARTPKPIREWLEAVWKKFHGD